MSNKLSVWLLLVLVFLIVIGLLVLLLLPNRKLVSNDASQSLVTLFPGQKIATFGDLPAGYYVAFPDNESFLLLGELDSVRIEKNGDIVVDLTFRLSRGAGVQTQREFLLYTNDKFVNGIILTRANTLSLSIPTQDSKTVLLKPSKGLDGTLGVLQNYIHQKIILLLNTVVYPATIRTAVNQSKDKLSDLASCNKSFYEAIDTNSQLPTCVPFIYELTVYDKNF